jgi:hypothetical protein
MLNFEVFETIMVLKVGCLPKAVCAQKNQKIKKIKILKNC